MLEIGQQNGPSGPPAGASRASELERRLGLPPGAWRRRRLFLLTVQTGELHGLGIPAGSRLVVEPGDQAAPGRVIVVRQNGALRLAKQAELPDGSRTAVALDPSELPYPLPECRPVGTVIAVLGPENTRKHRARRPVGSVTGVVDPGVRLANKRRLESLLAGAGRLAGGGSGGRSPALSNTYRRIEALAKCLDAVEAARLYDALVDEINRLVRRLRRSSPVGAHLPLLIPADPQRGARSLERGVRGRKERVFGHERTKSTARGVDRAMSEVI